MDVRRMRADEGMAFREVRLRALEQAPGAYSSTLADAAALDEATWHDRAYRGANGVAEAMFVVDRGDCLGGIVYVRVNEDAPHDAMVSSMWLDEDLRGGGLADALLRAAEGWGRAVGAPRVELWAAHDNLRGRRFYERNGYVPSGVEEIWERGGGALMYLKDLESEVCAPD